MRKLSIIVAGLVLAAGLSACGSSSDGTGSYGESSYSDTSSVDTTTPTYDSTPSSSGTVSQADTDQLGREICADLRNGMTRADEWRIFSSVGITPQQAAQIMVAAVSDYCPDQMGNL